jgi:ATP-dependent exoDNAse (exonuclease V) beta subunit
MPLTPSQLAAVDVSNLGRNVCVVAGPGSGKTRVLVEYFTRLVAQGVPPSRILAITFTEKAANNVKERLAEAFEDDPALRRELERAHVSTVHGFCARLLRENAVFAGIDPEFRVLDEQESVALRHATAAAILDDAWRREPDGMERLLEAVETADLASPLLDVYEAVRDSGQPLASLRDHPPPAAPGFEDLLAGIAQVRRLARTGENEQVDKLLAWGERYEALGGEPARAEHFQALAAIDVNLNRMRRHPAYAAASAFKKETADRVHRRLLAEYFACERERLVELLEEFDRAYRLAKQQAGGLDFADLEEATVRLLRGDTALRERVRAQFDQVLMDEYQDTNGMQARLVELVRPPGRFFVVGDINQSIYGFRHAEPDVFRAYRETVEAGGGRLVDLPDNFRSRPDILRMVETMMSGAPGIDPRRLVARREFAAAPKEPSIEVIAAVAPSIDEAVEIECRFIARRIIEMDDTPFGKIAVLVRNSEMMDPLARAFDEFGAPYLVSRGKGFFETREVRDLMHLIRVLVNPLDEIAMAAVLRSPLVSVSDEALLWLKETAPAFHPAAALPTAAESLTTADVERLARFAAQLERWRREADAVGFDRLLARALDETGYPFEPGSRAAGNIEKFLALARRASGKRSLFGFARDLELLREADPREADAPPEDAVNAVRVMTIHAAKGLEFPVVFVAGLHKGVSTNMGALVFSPRIGLGVRWRGPGDAEGKGDVYENAIRNERKLREEQESNRVLYVAMTRAEERLVLSFSSNGRKCDQWAARAADTARVNLETSDGIPREVKLWAPDGETFPVRVVCANAAPARPAPRLSAGARPSPAVLSRPARSGQFDSNATVTALNLFANCPQRYLLSRYIGWEDGRGQPLGADEEPAEEADVPASEFGRQVHALLAGETVENADPAAAALARSFPESELGRRVARAARAEREFDFVLALEGIVLRGQIDLWFEEGGELVLVDYKTDQVKAAEAAAQARGYELQLRLYAMALERVTGRAPDRACVHFLRLNRSVAVELAHSLFDDPLQTVREFRDAQERLAFPLREGSHCWSCPHFRGACPAAVPR